MASENTASGSKTVPSEFVPKINEINEEYPGEFTYAHSDYGKVKCNICVQEVFLDIKSDRGGVINRIKAHTEKDVHRNWKMSKKSAATSSRSKIESFMKPRPKTRPPSISDSATTKDI